MAIYIIGDLHLSFQTNKPMDIFGNNWQNHEIKIKKNWEEKVKDEDTVILAGDISWAMNKKEALEDFLFIEKLPGKKIILKGNHDYWWETVTNMKKFFVENNIKTIDFLYNNSFLVEDKIIVGTRCWNILDKDIKMIEREKIRLNLSIEHAIKNNEDLNNKEIIAIFHYPPILSYKKDNNGFTQILKDNNIQKCYYGHLHAKGHIDGVNEVVEDIEYRLISADYIDFDLVKI